MRLSRLALLKGAGWTIAAYGTTQFLRVLTNLALTRLLVPEIFGLMAIVNSVKTGIDLISDVGIETNIVHNKEAGKSKFYNTAWSLQIVRGLVLCIVCAAIGYPLAGIFGAPILRMLLPIAGLYLAIGGFVSVGRALVQKELDFAKINVFELTIESFSSAIFIVFAIVSPTVWAVILAGLVGGIARMIGSYFLQSSIRHRFYISKKYAKEILNFGKWIFLSSTVYFFSISFDRLYLGKVAPLALLGMYGIARALSEPFGALIVRIGNYVVFPTVASFSGLPRREVRSGLGPARLGFLSLVVGGLGFFAATADLVVSLIYDQRYQAVGWMLPFLILGTWFSIVSSLNESVLLGIGRPAYAAASNAAKLVYILIALPSGFASYGMTGAVIVMAVADLARYIPSLIGMLREELSFAKQDAGLTLALIGVTFAFEWLRCSIGLGLSFSNSLLQ
ncbi:oligosaccharide flippase family protein [Bradyrhizobium genosp. P]|uniref:oligosaccharide flippase family protein n=1 Tax=Bradyrhizobium genosp. P TaxID=83641 RepID=UPI003CE954AD